MNLNSLDKVVRGLKPGLKQYEHALGSGLSVRVSPSGTKQFRLALKLGGKTKRLPLGFYGPGGVTLTEALSKATELRTLAKSGADPTLKTKRAKLGASAEAPVTVAELVERWADGPLQKAGGRWRAEARRIADKDVVPKLGGWRITDVTKADLAALVSTKAKVAPVAANRLAAVLGGLFNHAELMGWLPVSPAVRLPRPTNERPRERVLSAEEVREAWALLQQAIHGAGPILPVHARVLALLLLTGARSEEVSRLTLGQFDQEGSAISIGTKTDASRRTLPLGPVARGLVQDAIRASAAKDPADLLFPQPEAGGELASP
ncbi:integrase family protein, partial [Nostoc sp. NIES-2111]